MIASVNIADVGIATALKAVRKAPKPAEIPGLRQAGVGFCAPLGRRVAGVIPSPDLHRVGLIALWDDDDALDRFEQDHRLAGVFANGWRMRLAPLRAFGTWPGLPADVPRSRATNHTGPVAVLTLGRMRFLRAPAFFQTSIKAERAAIADPGLLWATGMAKPPFVATCSLWASAEASAAYAFTHAHPHHDAIEAGRAKPFHHQEAFIRFRPYGLRGALAGKNPLPEHLAA